MAHKDEKGKHEWRAIIWLMLREPPWYNCLSRGNLCLDVSSSSSYFYRMCKQVCSETLMVNVITRRTITENGEKNKNQVQKVMFWMSQWALYKMINWICVQKIAIKIISLLEGIIKTKEFNLFRNQLMVL
jgi:hypothetical protein